MFAHGQEDTYILPAMSVAMYNAKKRGIRKLYLAPHAKHAESLPKNREAYEQQLGEFLTEVGLA
jgi:fermentation-respiration switch protein FrsA (DUF1100 family)